MNNFNNTITEACEKSLDWCKNNQGWQRICDIIDSSVYTQTWDDLPSKTKKEWKDQFTERHAKDAWEEFGVAKTLVPEKIIGADGKVYDNIIEATNAKVEMMTVLKTGYIYSED